MKSLQETLSPRSICFGCGPANPGGLQIRSFPEGDELVCDFTPKEHHRAFGQVVNGGIIGAVFDCHSNWTAAYHLMQRRGDRELPATVTSDFHVTLKRVTPAGQPIRVRARVVESADPKVIVEAEIESGGKVTATCRGTFVAVEVGHPAFHRWGAENEADS
jgi:acyl-coenzyme A thioesterase PaaI-like protein